MTGFGGRRHTASVDFYEWLFAHGRHPTRVKVTLASTFLVFGVHWSIFVT